MGRYGWKIGNNSRPDPYADFLEWNSDSRRILPRYRFTDDEYVEHRGAAIYDMRGGHIQKLIPYKNDDVDSSEPKKPGNFHW